MAFNVVEVEDVTVDVVVVALVTVVDVIVDVVVVNVLVAEVVVTLVVVMVVPMHSAEIRMYPALQSVQSPVSLQLVQLSGLHFGPAHLLPLQMPEEQSDAALCTQLAPSVSFGPHR